MIEQEVLDIVADASDDGQRLNDLVDEFRSGRDIEEINLLLDASDPELVSIGAWILGELRFEVYQRDTIISRLHSLTDHAAPGVRLSALGALFPALDPTQATTKMLLQKLLRDPNEGVRRAAEAAASRLSQP